MFTQGWISTGLYHLENIPLLISLPILYLAGCILRLPYIILISMVYHKRKKLTILNTLGIALVFAGLDNLLISINPDIFGYGIITYSYLVQIADLGSGTLLSFFLILVNLYLGLFIAQKNYQALACVLGLLTITMGYSLYRLDKLKSLNNIGSPLKVLIIQGATKDNQKINPKDQLESYINQTKNALKQYPLTELVVWPETAYPGEFPLFSYDGRKDFSQIPQTTLDFFKTLNVPFIFGSNRVEDDKYFNTGFLYYRSFSKENFQVSHMDFYDKKKLIPVGESKVPFLSSLKTEFVLGESKDTMSFSHHQRQIIFKPMICFESVFPGAGFSSAEETSLLVTLNNDSWFKGSDEPRIHFLASQLRSIETRKPQIIASETGHSAFISKTGEIIGFTRYGEKTVLYGELLLNPPLLTWAGKMYQILPILFIILGTGIFFSDLIEKVRSHSK